MRWRCRRPTASTRILAAQRLSSTAHTRAAATTVTIAQVSTVVAVATLDDLLAFATRSTTLSCEHARLVDYRARYGSQQ